jgi:exopolysaccharide production protein ExoY
VEPNRIIEFVEVTECVQERLAMLEIARKPSGNLTANSVSLRPIGGSAKRLVDIVLATFGMVILLPLFSLCLLGTFLSSHGSVIYRHRRIGFQGRRFECLKFRTMAPCVDKLLHGHLSANPQAKQKWEQTRKLRHDPRMTLFGTIMHKTGLDELPQLFNVLKGDMSIVGPRPMTDDEIERHAHRVSAYLACRPGITGPWQISGRSETGYGTRVTFDDAYARNWSLLMDVKIMLGTLPAVLDSDDAY